MLARFRTSLTKKDNQKSQRSLNVNEEYLCAVRTKSFADFFLKFQLLVNEPSSSSSYNHLGFSEIFLDPGQETITSVLESSSLFSSNNSSSSSDGLKSLLLNYFDISAEASDFCSHLLKTLSHLQADYRFIHKIIGAINDDTRDHSQDQFTFVFSELRSRVILNNPFSNVNGQNFKRIHDKHSSVLQRLRSNRKKAARKMKVMKIFNRASGVCATATCGLLASAAMFVAAQTLTALLVAPAAVLSLPTKPLKKKIRNFRVLKYGSLGKIVDQLDVAAKGAYILNRDFDTMSRLVGRLGDEIEHNKVMIKLCLDRRDDKVMSIQILKEIKKYELGFKKQMEELEEHVYLCLVTINRARAMVVKEISKDVV